MKSITERYWQLPTPFIPEKTDRELARRFGVAPEIIRLLNNRGVTTGEEIRRFLYPTLHDLENPATMKDMDTACSLLYEATMAGSEILIWGDYDVDGVTATSLLVRFLRLLGMQVDWFVPDRFTDGYGLKREKIRDLLEKRTKCHPVLLTVDCGITNHQEVAYAKELGAQVIITDHHEPDDLLPPADAILNPKQPGCNFATQEIAGVGIAFYLAMGLRAYFRDKGYFTDTSPPNIKELLELVAIGTIADMVPLQKGNRVLVKAGFEVINSSPSIGVAALLTESDIYTAAITAEDIAFQIAPKINAAGRLASASIAVELLLSSDETAAQKYARQLALLNQRRKKLCSDCLEFTLGFVDDSLPYGTSCHILQVEYSIGILGIVASQLAEKTRGPVILVAPVEDERQGTLLKGSARSIPGVNIHALLQKCRETLLHFGGHPMAAGVTLKPEDLETFRERFFTEYQVVTHEKPGRDAIDLEMVVEEALKENLIRQLQLLEPFGAGNEKPIFLDHNIILQDIRKVGRNGDHLVFNKRGRFANSSCIAFRFGRFAQTIRSRPSFSMVYTLSLSRFKRAETWQAHLLDLLEG